MTYNHKEIEQKWQKYWDDNHTFFCNTADFSKPKYYALDMFPYPSGIGLHAGHPEGYTATDIICRKKRMEGYNVLHPMGFDSFGLPAEQYAISTGNHPEGFTLNNIETFRRQLKMLGFSYDWSKEISTCDPAFYHWTQWIFKQLFEAGLAKCTEMPVNWCEELQTVLANDEVIDGKSERGGYPVVKKMMKQWVIDIVAYAEKLLSGLDELDWPESTKEMQRNWIGKSIGAQVNFQVADRKETFTVFTTRCDTLFGVTYCVLSPEHPLVDVIVTEEQKEAVKSYIQASSMKSEIERIDVNKEKTGIFTGAYAINPVNQKRIPIWVSDYVLNSYGTGAIMAVPAHDQRDYDFAIKFQIPMQQVLEGKAEAGKAMVDDGLHIHSEFLNGLNKEDAIEKMMIWLKENQIGDQKVNYKLREWIFARQRYWGEPIPVVEMEDCRYVVLSDDELPLLLPQLKDYVPSGGKSPLDKATDWVNVEIAGKKGKRETSTMPGSAGSSWYFLRYIDPHNDKELADYNLLKHWLPVDLYVGGPEHVVGHLLYARMWNQFLFDKQIVPVKEPFQKLVHQGMILGANGIKMGKRFPEFVIDPETIIEMYGADTLRLYEMFMGPLEASKPWSNQGVEGARRWLERVERLVTNNDMITDEDTPELDFTYHTMLKKVSNDIETLSFNTAISQMMIFVNDCYKNQKVNRKMIISFVKVLSPFTPHLAEELYQYLGFTQSIAYATWPKFDENKLIEQNVVIVVQINGKVRGKFNIAKDMDLSTVEKYALSLENIQTYLIGKEIVKKIVIPNKIVNIVVK